MPTNQYGDQPCYGELAAIVLIGVGHVLIEIALALPAAQVYNISVSIAALVYIVWRVRRSPQAPRRWGFRTDNALPAIKSQLPFLGVALLGLIGFAIYTGSPGLPKTFWLTIALYPVWGIIQQFALQNFIAINLESVISNAVLLSLIAALLFAASHFPRLDLLALSLVGGFFFTLAYRRHPNLWVVGSAHGILGSIVFYVVLRQDPGAEIIDFVTGY
jgi:membrane protease YdiL (CAAX protease family)